MVVHGVIAYVRYRRADGWTTASIQDSDRKRTLIGWEATVEPIRGERIVAAVEERGRYLRATDVRIEGPFGDRAEMDRWIRRVLPRLPARLQERACEWRSRQEVGRGMPGRWHEYVEAQVRAREVDYPAFRTLRKAQWERDEALTTVRALQAEYDDPMAEIERNPYVLAGRGASWERVDRLAAGLGVTAHAPQRLAGAVAGALYARESLGDTSAARVDVVRQAGRLADVSTREIDEAMPLALADSRIEGVGTALRLRRYGDAERVIARRVRELLAQPERPRRIAEEWLLPAQRAAVEMALSSPLGIITGGPGTGKTTIVRALAEAADGPVLLVAPTATAAVRLSEAVGAPATTVHRALLGAHDGQRWHFGRNAGEPLPIRDGIVVCDEASMLDEEMAAALLLAIPDGSRLALVGDVDQLGSVAPGCTLRDLIACGHVPTVRLTRPIRFDQEIAGFAAAVKEGTLLPLDRQGAIALHESADPMDVVRIAADAVASGTPLSQVRVITPMRLTDWGTVALNCRLREALNPWAEREGLVLRARVRLEDGTVFQERLAPGDRVLNRLNARRQNAVDEDLLIANGDLLNVIACGTNKERKIPWVHALTDAGREVRLEGREVDKLQLGYAGTVHGAQGAEADHVIVVVRPEHERMLDRQLLYTALTRAKKTLTFVGSREALRVAVATLPSVSLRQSGLGMELARELAVPVIAMGGPTRRAAPREPSLSI